MMSPGSDTADNLRHIVKRFIASTQLPPAMWVYGDIQNYTPDPEKRKPQVWGAMGCGRCRYNFPYSEMKADWGRGVQANLA